MKFTGFVILVENRVVCVCLAIWSLVNTTNNAIADRHRQSFPEHQVGFGTDGDGDGMPSLLGPYKL